jgi:hypothetical protein
VIQFICSCGVRHEQASPVLPDCWRPGCGQKMQPYAEMDTAVPIGELVQEIVADLAVRVERQA